MFKKIIIIGLLIIPAAFLYAQEPAADDPEKTATVVSEETKASWETLNPEEKEKIRKIYSDWEEVPADEAAFKRKISAVAETFPGRKR